MSSVISTVGGWTVITGLIALELNALTYIKNLHDAGNAENTDELLFESDSPSPFIYKTCSKVPILSLSFPPENCVLEV